MIAHAAIRYPNGEVFGPSFGAKRHSHVIAVAARRGMRSGPDCEQGFVTHTGYFMSRSEAKQHAISVGQLHPSHHGELFSEDLWPEPQKQPAMEDM